jgi:anti-sigma factor RsiW
VVPEDEPNFTPSQLADLTALADGSIDPGRRADVEEWIAASPDRRELLRRERLAVARLHEARMADRAPESLRRRIEERRTADRRRAWRPSLGAGVAVAGGVAAAAAALAIVLPAGTPGTPAVAQAAALAARGPTHSAPSADPQDPRARLELAVGDVYFPNWAHGLGWQAVGQRHDVLDGRPARTVYYGWKGRQLAYTIVGKPALRQPRAPRTVVRGWDLRTLELHGRTVVTWRRAGHTCVISATGIPTSVLQRLATYQPPSH